MVRRSDDGSLRPRPAASGARGAHHRQRPRLRPRQPCRSRTCRASQSRQGKAARSPSLMAMECWWSPRCRESPRLCAHCRSRSEAAAARRGGEQGAPRLPVHRPELQALIGGPTPCLYGPHHLRSARRLSVELARIRRQGWAHDKGEYAPSIQAFAAPRSRTAPAKSSRPSAFPILPARTKAHMEKIRVSVIAVAGAIAADLPRAAGVGRHRRDRGRPFDFTPRGVVRAWIDAPSVSP